MTQIVTQLKNWKCYKTQKIKIGQNSNNQNVTKHKNYKCDKTETVTTLKNYKFDN